MANLLKDDDLHPYGYHYTTFGLEVSRWAYLDRPKKGLLVRTTAYHSHSVMLAHTSGIRSETGHRVTPKRADLESDFRSKVEAVPGVGVGTQESL
jgi:hypothetical protein